MVGSIRFLALQIMIEKLRGMDPRGECVFISVISVILVVQVTEAMLGCHDIIIIIILLVEWENPQLIKVISCHKEMKGSVSRAYCANS